MDYIDSSDFSRDEIKSIKINIENALRREVIRQKCSYKVRSIGRKDIFVYLKDWIKICYLDPIYIVNRRRMVNNFKERSLIDTWIYIADLCGYDDIDEFNSVVLDS